MRQRAESVGSSEQVRDDDRRRPEYSNSLYDDEQRGMVLWLRDLAHYCRRTGQAFPFSREFVEQQAEFAKIEPVDPLEKSEDRCLWEEEDTGKQCRRKALVASDYGLCSIHEAARERREKRERREERERERTESVVA